MFCIISVCVCVTCCCMRSCCRLSADRGVHVCVAGTAPSAGDFCGNTETTAVLKTHYYLHTMEYVFSLCRTWFPILFPSYFCLFSLAWCNSCHDKLLLYTSSTYSTLQGALEQAHATPGQGLRGRLCLDVPSWGCSGVLSVWLGLCATGWVKGLWFRLSGLWREGLIESWYGTEPVKRGWGAWRTRLSEKQGLKYTERVMRCRDFWADDWSLQVRDWIVLFSDEVCFIGLFSGVWLVTDAGVVFAERKLTE